MSPFEKLPVIVIGAGPVPDALGAARSRYVGKRVVIVGSGRSSAALAELADEGGHVELTWAVRGKKVTRAFGGGVSDALPARGWFGTELPKLQETGRLELVTDACCG